MTFRPCRIAWLLLLVLILTSCGKPSADSTHEWEGTGDPQVSPASLLGSAKSLIARHDPRAAKDELQRLLQEFPSSPQSKDAALLLKQTEREIQILQAAEEEARREESRKRQEEEKLAQQRRTAALKRMRCRHDDMEGIDWYQDIQTPSVINCNGMYLYIGKKKDGAPWLRLRIQYAAEEWLFIRGYKIRTDSTVHDITPDLFSSIERDNGYGGIWEWYDTGVDASTMAILADIVSSRNVKLRYVGDHNSHDRVLSQKEILAMRNVLEAFRALGG